MSLFHSLILGVLEGLTEFLPVSSTAHLIIASKLLEIPEGDVLTTFQISIQVGAILAVFIFFLKKFFNIELLMKLALAFVPTGIAGLLIYPHLKTIFAHTEVLVSMLFLGGIAILLVEKWYAKKYAHNHPRETITWKDAILIGTFQALAIIPGTSRSGATIIGGLLLGLKRSVIAEFTFLLAVPTMVVATAYTLYKNHALLTTDGALLPIALGTVTAFLIALYVIKFFLTYIRTREFSIFGWYRIVLAVVAAFVFFM